MTQDKAIELIEEVALRLGEHFDALQILATWSEGGVCHFEHMGSGNLYARQGMAHDFIDQWRAQTEGQELRSFPTVDTDGDDDAEPTPL